LGILNFYLFKNTNYRTDFLLETTPTKLKIEAFFFYYIGIVYTLETHKRKHTSLLNQCIHHSAGYNLLLTIMHFKKEDLGSQVGTVNCNSLL